jgi:hypothetical protein
MKTKRSVQIALVLSLILVGLWSFSRPTRADVGPKPSMAFQFVYEIEGQPTIVEGQQMQCEEPDCADAQPLEELGPQRFYCSEDTCSSMAYGYTTYNQLAIRFSDGVTRTSNVFSSGTMRATYQVTVRADDLVVDRVGPNRTADPLLWRVFGVLGGGAVAFLLGIMLAALTIWLILRAWRSEDGLAESRTLLVAVWGLSLPLLDVGTAYSFAPLVTLVIEGVVVLIYAVASQRHVFVWLTQVLVVNMVTQPALWLLVASQRAHLPYALILFLAEPMIWLGEAALLYLLQGKQLSFKRALILSLILNVISVGVGLLLPV